MILSLAYAVFVFVLLSGVLVSWLFGLSILAMTCCRRGLHLEAFAIYFFGLAVPAGLLIGWTGCVR